MSDWNDFLRRRKHLSPKQFAEVLDLKQKTIYNWLYNGLIEGNRIGASKFGRIRIPITEVERIIEGKPIVRRTDVDKEE